jgi:hypothetical protein
MSKEWEDQTTDERLETLKRLISEISMRQNGIGLQLEELNRAVSALQKKAGGQ